MPIRNHTRTWLPLAAALLLSSLLPTLSHAQPTCTVDRVVDGDTMILHCPARVRTRLLAIDAPERDQKPYGAAATALLSRLAPRGTRVRVETDIKPRDRYGRLLAYIYLPNGQMLNEAMARAGYVAALSYPPNVRHTDRIRRAVADARAAKRGLWATPAFDCAPRDHRARRC